MQENLVLVRNSERAKFKECLQAWHWGYRHTFEPVRRRGALSFGGMVHDSLAGWYVPGIERGEDPAETFMRLFVENAEEFDQWDDEGNRVPADELGWAMLTEYVNYWGDDSGVEIIQPEMAFQIDVYDEKGNYLATLVGRFDAIGRNRKTGWYFVWEHKTGKSIEHVRINSRYGEQGLSYWWAANYWLEHVLNEKINLAGVGFNWLRKAMPDERPQNEQGLYLNKPTKKDPEGAVSKRQPLPFFSRQFMPLGVNQTDNFNRRLRKELMAMALVRDRKAGVYKNPGMHCNWCQFRDVCELHEMGEDWETVLKFEFKKWKPYSDHELHLELVS